MPLVAPTVDAPGLPAEPTSQPDRRSADHPSRIDSGTLLLGDGLCRRLCSRACGAGSRPMWGRTGSKPWPPTPVVNPLADDIKAFDLTVRPSNATGSVGLAP